MIQNRSLFRRGCNHQLHAYVPCSEYLPINTLLETQKCKTYFIYIEGHGYQSKLAAAKTLDYIIIQTSLFQVFLAPHFFEVIPTHAHMKWVSTSAFGVTYSRYLATVLVCGVRWDSRWGGLITVSCTCAHLRHATLLYFLLHFHTRTHTHVMLQVRYCTFSRTSTLMSCYATVCWLALPHAHTHTSCYKCATVHSLALPHSCLATLLYFLLHFHMRTHTHITLQVRYCTFYRASTLMSCYATVLSLAAPHGHTRTHVMLQVRYCTFSRTSTLMSYWTFSCSSTRTH